MKGKTTSKSQQGLKGWTERLVNSNIVKTIDSLDKRWSAKIHNLDLPKILQVYIAFFAVVCNKEGPVML